MTKLDRQLAQRWSDIIDRLLEMRTGNEWAVDGALYYLTGKRSEGDLPPPDSAYIGDDGWVVLIWGQPDDPEPIYAVVTREVVDDES